MLNIEASSAISEPVFKFACVGEPIWQFQFPDSVHDAAGDFTRVVSIVREENLAIAIRLVVDKVTLEDGTVAKL